MAAITPRVRNDPAQYDDLAGQWWDPRGTFAMLHWLAQARAALVPPAARPGAVLIDVGCGAGLLAPHVARLGYRLVGVDLTRSALVQAAEHGVTAVQADASVLPLADGCADVVCAGEILEHVADLRAAVRETCRVLRPGGVLVVDTIAATFLARLLVITVAERIPRAAPPGLHDPALFVDRQVLISECARHGVRLQLNGLRPGAWSVLRWLRRRQPTARMVRTWSTAVLFQGRGTKESRVGGELRSRCAGTVSSWPRTCGSRTSRTRRDDVLCYSTPVPSLPPLQINLSAPPTRPPPDPPPRQQKIAEDPASAEILVPKTAPILHASPIFHANWPVCPAGSRQGVHPAPPCPAAAASPGRLRWIRTPQWIGCVPVPKPFREAHSIQDLLRGRAQ